MDSASVPIIPVTGTVTKGYGKGMPYGSSSMMMSKGMGKGMSFGSQSFPGPPQPETPRETIWDGLFGSDTPRSQNTPRSMQPMQTMPMSQPMMVPIPWQQPKTQEQPQQETRHAGFDRMGVDQLQAMAETRNKTIESLKREIEELQDDDQKHEDRLSALERQFGALANGSEIKLKAPLLAKISKVVRESHLLDHEEGMDTLKVDSHGEVWHDVDPWKYMHSENLVLGRGYMGLDQHAIAKKLWEEERERNKHAVKTRMHYAGHIAKPAENVECLFVKEAGVFQQQPLHPAPYRNAFWLSLDGPSRADVQANQVQAEAMEDPVARRIGRQDKAGTGYDVQPMDWVEMKKRGEMINEFPKQSPGFQMPKWMY